MEKIEPHPIKEHFIPKGCKVLIMGTFPPKDAYYKKPFFYYQSVRNHLWNRMDNIFFNEKKTLKYTKSSKETVLENIQNKKEFLKKKKIGMIDYMVRIKRKRKSSKDKDLEVVEDVLTNGFLINILKKNNSIKGILCTYKTAYEKLEDNDKFKEIADKVDVIQLLPASRSRDKREVKDKNYKDNLKKCGIIIP